MNDVAAQTALQHAADLIGAADALIITAGAGMGVDSGLPDFRGDEGLWQTYMTAANKKLDIMELASPQTSQDDPAFAWGFYGERFVMYRQTQPHAGFQILKSWSDSKRFGSWVYTSNVDGHFQNAGFDAQRVQECHGSIHYPCQPSPPLIASINYVQSVQFSNAIRVHRVQHLYQDGPRLFE